MLMSFIVLYVIIGIRTFFVQWSHVNDLPLTILEVLFNSIIVIDYFLNLIYAPEKKVFVFSMYLLQPSSIPAIR